MRFRRMALDRRKESTYFDDVHSLFVCQRERADRMLGPRRAHRDAMGWSAASLSRASRQAACKSALPPPPLAPH